MATMTTSTRRRLIGAALGALVLALVLALAAGLRPLVIRSDSMLPTFRAGDMLFVRAVPVRSVAIGDVVTFADSSRGGELVTHRVIATEQRGHERALITRGDQNTGVERWAADLDATVGVPVLAVPHLGFVVNWLVMPQVRLLITLAALLLLAGATLHRWSAGAGRPNGAVSAVSGGLVVAALAVALSGVPGDTFGAFSGTTSNTGNTFTTAATFDTTPPSVAISFPLDGDSYNVAAWGAGCGTPAVDDFCGTAADAGGSGVSLVEVSIRQGADNYWNGTSFASASEVRFDANGTTSWSYDFDATDFLVDDSYTIRAFPTDGAGNIGTPVSTTFTVDMTAPPAPTISAAPANPTNLTTASFSFSDTEAGVTFECRLDAAAFTSCSSPRAYAGLGEGSHTFRVRAVDDATNASTVTSSTWTIDTTDPTAVIAFPIGGGSYNTSGYSAGCGTAATGDVCGTAADTGGGGVSSVDVSVQRGSGNYWNGTTFGSASEVQFAATGSTTWSWPFAAGNFPADGAYTIRARATDGAGNVGSAVSAAFTVDDTAPPAPTIAGGPANPTSTTAASFSFSDTEAGVTFHCDLDGGGFAACSSPKAYSGLGQGSHTFQVRALDAAGNASSPDSFTWTIDTTPPTAAVTFPAAGGAYNTSGWSGACSTPASGDFCGTAADTGGAAVSVVDVSIQEGAGNYWNGTMFGSATEVLFTATGTTSWSSALAAASFPADGAYTVRARPTDSVGNVGSFVSATFTIDRVAPPAPTISGGPANPTSSTSASFTFGDTEAGVTFECDLDGGGFAACTSPKAYIGLGQGSHTFEVRAVDAAANASASVSSTWTVDTTAPTATITFPAGGAAYNAAGWNGGCGSPATGDVCGTSTDAGGTGVSLVEVSLQQGSGNYWNGTTFGSATEVHFTATGTTSWSYAFAAANFAVDGTYTLRAKATDGVTLVSSVDSSTFTIDRIAPPAPTITSNPTNPSASASASFGFSDTEAGVTFECQLDGGGFGACTTPQAYAGLADGSHTFEVRAVDAASNTSTTTSYTWTVDTLAPTISITFPVNGSRYNTTRYNAGCGTAGTGDLCGTAADAGTGVTQVQVSIQQGTGKYWNGTNFNSNPEVLFTATGTTSWTYAFPIANFTDGAYTIRARATDGMGTVTTATSTITIDRIAPTGSNIQTTNKAGGINGKAELGDTITYTFSEAIDPATILAGWNGASTNVVLRLNNGGAGNDTVAIFDSANTAQLALGSVSMSRIDYVTGNVTFGATGTASTMVMSGSTVTITLGTVSNALLVGTAAGNGAMAWTPSAAALDIAGNACTTTVTNETGNDKDF
jgi:signal peptidase I